MVDVNKCQPNLSLTQSQPNLKLPWEASSSRSCTELKDNRAILQIPLKSKSVNTYENEHVHKCMDNP